MVLNHFQNKQTKKKKKYKNRLIYLKINGTSKSQLINIEFSKLNLYISNSQKFNL